MVDEVTVAGDTVTFFDAYWRDAQAKQMAFQRDVAADRERKRYKVMCVRRAVATGAYQLGYPRLG